MEPPASLKDCLGVDVLQRLEIHAFFEDIIKACHFEKWFSENVMLTNTFP